jgi:alkanesulfonate monooxygenase SsuD/methylene tetrahydromethanopterin reductase-like flavin-dependent oxidoreductase (luciferase family)
MMQPSPAAPSAASRPPIQFYSVQLMPLSDGRMSVGVGATLCETVDEADFELVNMDVASARVDTIDEALAVIRQAVASTI